MRADRLLSLVLLLQARGRMTAAELAGALEVSVRTVYRDLDVLSTAGVPVFAEAGTGGGCQLLDSYRFPLGPLSSEEAAALLVLGVPEVLAELSVGGALMADHNRLLATSSLAGGDWRRLVHLDMPRWFHHAEPAPCLATLAQALQLSRWAEITYPGAKPKAVRSRPVGPLGLVNKAGVWYLVAMLDSERISVFRVGRLTAARVLHERFDFPSGFDLVSYWQNWSQEFQASIPRLGVVVRASALAMRIMPEVLGNAARDAISQATGPDELGWCQVHLNFESKEAAAHKLLGFGDQVEVVSPGEVRRHLVATATAALKRYSAHS